MFKATVEEINAKINNYGVMQAYGVVSISQTNTAVSYLSMVAKADNMEAKALELIASAEDTFNQSYDLSTQSRMQTAIKELKSLFA